MSFIKVLTLIHHSTGFFLKFVIDVHTLLSNVDKLRPFTPSTQNRVYADKFGEFIVYIYISFLKKKNQCVNDCDVGLAGNLWLQVLRNLNVNWCNKKTSAVIMY